MKREIVLVGGGGHCRACIDVIEQENKFKIAGIVDVKERVGEKVLGYKIIAGDHELTKLTKSFGYFLITIGQIKSVDKRVEKFTLLKRYSASFPTIASPLAYVSKHAAIDEGSIILHGAIIGPGVRIGKNCIINTRVDIEHDVKIGNYCHISTGCTVNGDCSLGSKIFVGSNTVINQGVSITDDIIIGSGSVVTKPIEEKGTYYGAPSRKR